MALTIPLLAAVLLKSIGTAVGDDTEESKGASQGFAGSKCAWCHDLMTRVLPLSAIKIVVVVWQIVYQVGCDKCSCMNTVPAFDRYIQDERRSLHVNWPAEAIEHPS